MKLIIRLQEMLTEERRSILNGCVSAIVFESKLIPILGVEAEDLDLIRQLDFVTSARTPDVGMFQGGGDFFGTIIFDPPVTKQALIKNNMFGWGNTRIFILDSGVNDDEVSVVEHNDFTGTGSRDARDHGTVVARIVKHFAKGASIYSGKIGQDKPEEYYLLPALEWAYEKGANIINISAGFDRKKPCDGTCELCELVDIISSKGVLVVVAAGNSEQRIDSIACPGRSSESVTVGAVDKNDNIADYSSIGRPGGTKPNLVAPGMVRIDSSLYSGTSFSAPLVSGVLGAVYSKVRNVFDLPKYLYSTLRELRAPSHHQGQGCLDIERFVEVIINEEINSKGEGQKQGN